MRRSDLFVGLMWRRWGTNTRQYSSGFEEEYALALEQRSKGELEDIWLFFKDVPEEMLRDPGEQLRKVLQFKEDVTTNREVLYDRFASTEEWSRMLVNYTSDYLTKDLWSGGKAQAGVAPTSNKPVVSSPSENSVEHSMSMVSSALVQGTVNEVSLLQAARAYMASSSLFYLKQRDSQPMGTHESNVIYSLRAEVSLTAAEQLYVLRNLVADTDNLRAGWYCLNSKPSEWLTNVLLAIAGSDGSDDARWKALELMEHIESNLDLKAIEHMIDDENVFIATSALTVYSRRAPDALSKVKQLLNHRSSEVSALAWREVLSILSHSNPQQAVDWVLNHAPPHTPTYVEVLQPLWLSQDLNLIRPLTKAGSAVTRLKAFEISKGVMTEDEVRQFAMDPDSGVKAAAYLELTYRGAEADEDLLEEALKDTEQTRSGIAKCSFKGTEDVPPYGLEDVLLELYKKLPYEAFETIIDWTSLKAPLKYEALATKYFDRSRDVVREDLRQNFSRIREPFYNGLRQVYGEQAESQMKEFKRLERFVASMFRVRAFKVLSKSPESIDAQLARDFLRGEHEDHDKEAITSAFRILSKKGTEEDSSLIEWALSHWDPVLKSEAATSLLNLPGNDFANTVRYLLGTEEEAVVRVALKWLLSTEKYRPPVDVVKETLYSKRDEIRLLVLSYVATTSSHEGLNSLLGEYPNSNKYYYYNVVCWLDRVLYGPPGLREMWMRQL